MLYRQVKGGVLMRSVILTLLLVALVGLPAFSGARAAEKTWEDWNFSLDLNLMLLSASGDASVTLSGDVPVVMPVDLTFGDMTDDYKGAVTGKFMAKKERWSVNVDLFYGKLEDEETVAYPLADGSGYSLALNSKNTLTLGEYEVFLGYQISDPDQGVSEIIFGARYISQELALKSTDAAATLTEMSLDESLDNSWWMGFIGARYMGPLAGSETWDLIIRADVGAFDTSGRLTWRTDLGTRWWFADSWHLNLMYKWIGVDYKKDDPGDPEYYEYKAIEHGPVIGIGVDF
jgi:hypothetical protein